MICQGCRIPHEGPERCAAPASCTCQHRVVLTPEMDDVPLSLVGGPEDLSVDYDGTVTRT